MPRIAVTVDMVATGTDVRPIEVLIFMRDVRSEIYFEQMNVFSAVVGIFGTRALDQHSVYEKVRHLDVAQTRFPDLRHRNSPRRGSPRYVLESKASKRPWAVQSHYDHEGWYIVWRYLVDATESIEPGRPVIIWRTDIAYLQKSDPPEQIIKVLRAAVARKRSNR
jgi:hypothetical protein